VQALSEAVDEMVGNLQTEFGIAPEKPAPLDEVKMSVREPVEPLFRVGAMALGYDAGRDRVLLVVQEAVGEEEERDPREVRFYAPRCRPWSAARRSWRGRSPEQRALQAMHSRAMATERLPETNAEPARRATIAGPLASPPPDRPPLYALLRRIVQHGLRNGHGMSS
jgi:hypothetical protein